MKNMNVMHDTILRREFCRFILSFVSKSSQFSLSGNICYSVKNCNDHFYWIIITIRNNWHFLSENLIYDSVIYIEHGGSKMDIQIWEICLIYSVIISRFLVIISKLLKYTKAAKLLDATSEFIKCLSQLNIKILILSTHFSPCRYYRLNDASTQ